MAVLYARSDLSLIAIPTESGGCGQAHARPVIKGAPVRTWQLNCPRCVAYLTRPHSPDPLWSGNPTKIPLTPDEERTAEAMQQENARMRAEHDAMVAYETAEKTRAQLASERVMQAAEEDRTRMEYQFTQMAEELERLRQIVSKIPAEPIRPEPAEAPVRDEPRTWDYPVTWNADGVSDVPGGPESVTDAVPARGAGSTKGAGATASPASSRSRCSSCGGPLRRPGARGGTPKGTCLDCRAKARGTA